MLEHLAGNDRLLAFLSFPRLKLGAIDALAIEMQLALA